jgi:hypothetical protein
MKLNSAVRNFLTNKWVLNIVAFLALFNIIGYMVLGNINAILHFIVFAVLVRYFSKNMTIVLGVPLIIVNLFETRGIMLEGMKNNNTSTHSKSETDNSQKAQNKIDEIVKRNKNKPDPKSSQGLPMQPLENASDNDNVATQSTGGEQQGFEPGRSKNRGHAIDYATTVEDAYDELNNILGGDGIQRLTSDTQNLMKQQMQLAKAMESMAPMMKSLAPMVENLKGMMGDSNVNDMMSLAKKFTGASATPANK